MLSIFFALAASFADPSPFDFSALANSPEWRRLVHYRTTILGNSISDVDSAGFFLRRTANLIP